MEHLYSEARQLVQDYLRLEMLPTIFCPGCGVGNVLQYILRAVDRAIQGSRMEFEKGRRESPLTIDDFVFVSGIGCSSRIPG